MSEDYDFSAVQVLTDTLVQRVVIEERDGVKKETGVQLADGRSISAKKEVVGSAGAYRTPKVLMLSGIGPKEDTAKVGIPVVLDAPEVGQDSFDHLDCFTWWKLRDPTQGLGTQLFTNPAYQLGLPNDWIASEHVPDAEMKKALVADGDAGDKHGLLYPLRCHTETLISYAAGGGHFAGVDVPMDLRHHNRHASHLPRLHQNLEVRPLILTRHRPEFLRYRNRSSSNASCFAPSLPLVPRNARRSGNGGV